MKSLQILLSLMMVVLLISCASGISKKEKGILKNYATTVLSDAFANEDYFVLNNAVETTGNSEDVSFAPLFADALRDPEYLSRMQAAVGTGCEVSSSHTGLYMEDPMVKICALPIDRDIDEVLAGISADVSRDTGIEEQYITYYWQPLTNVICMGEKTTNRPILVDLYVPGFFTNAQIASMMNSLAAAIEEHVGLDREWVFIQTHFPNQGQVYLSGEVQIFDDYKGPENEAEYSGE